MNRFVDEEISWFINYNIFCFFNFFYPCGIGVNNGGLACVASVCDIKCLMMINRYCRMSIYRQFSAKLRQIILHNEFAVQPIKSPMVDSELIMHIETNMRNIFTPFRRREKKNGPKEK